MSRLICGIGINDSRRSITGDIIYNTWKDMIRRCYDTKWQVNKPTYIKCTVCDEWLLYSKFKLWMEQQDYFMKQLDKDILYPGNTIYSPETCCFISRKLNMVLSGQVSNTKLPTGVSYDKDRRLYRAVANDLTSKQQYLGRFSSINEAVKAYRKYKVYILEQYLAIEESSSIRVGIQRHIAKLSLIWETPSCKIIEV